MSKLIETFNKFYIYLIFNFQNHKEFYFINFSILLLYLYPYLFFSAFTFLCIYKIYNEINIDFEFDIRIDRINSSKNILKNIITLDNKKTQ